MDSERNGSLARRMEPGNGGVPVAVGRRKGALGPLGGRGEDLAAVGARDVAELLAALGEVSRSCRPQAVPAAEIRSEGASMCQPSWPSGRPRKRTKPRETSHFSLSVWGVRQRGRPEVGPAQIPARGVLH